MWLNLDILCNFGPFYLFIFCYTFTDFYVFSLAHSQNPAASLPMENFWKSFWKFHGILFCPFATIIWRQNLIDSRHKFQKVKFKMTLLVDYTLMLASIWIFLVFSIYSRLAVLQPTTLIHLVSLFWYLILYLVKPVLSPSVTIVLFY